MRSILLPFAILFTSCAPTLAANQSALIAERIHLDSGGVVALPSTGETFDLSPLHAAEPTSADAQILKLRGSFLVVGPGFRRVWRLWPAGPDRLKYEPVALDPGVDGFRSVELSVAGGCALVRWQRAQGAAQAFLTFKGDVDARACRN